MVIGSAARWRRIGRRAAKVWGLGHAAATLALALAAAPTVRAQVNAFGVPNMPDAPAPEPQPPVQPMPANPQVISTPIQPPAPRPAPAPRYARPPAPPPPSFNTQAFMVSQWHGQTTDATGSWDIYVTFKPDGTFMQQQTTTNGSFRLGMVGRYTAEVGASTGLVSMSPQLWTPRVYCASVGNCKPINFPPTISVRFKVSGRDMVVTENGTFRRIGPAK